MSVPSYFCHELQNELAETRKYKEAWDAAYNKFKELCEIKDFHGLQFEDRHMVTLEAVIEYMDECLEVIKSESI